MLATDQQPDWSNTRRWSQWSDTRETLMQGLRILAHKVRRWLSISAWLHTKRELEPQEGW